MKDTNMAAKSKLGKSQRGLRPRKPAAKPKQNALGVSPKKVAGDSLKAASKYALNPIAAGASAAATAAANKNALGGAMKTAKSAMGDSMGAAANNATNPLGAGIAAASTAAQSMGSLGGKNPAATMGPAVNENAGAPKMPNLGFTAFWDSMVGQSGNRRQGKNTNGGEYRAGPLKGMNKAMGYEKMRQRWAGMSPDERKQFEDRANQTDILSEKEQAQINAYESGGGSEDPGKPEEFQFGAKKQHQRMKQSPLGAAA